MCDARCSLFPVCWLLTVGCYLLIVVWCALYVVSQMLF